MVKKIVDKHGNKNVIAVIGAPDADSAELYAETLVNGDPAWLGPLAGVKLDLPVYHILEPKIKEQIDPAVYKEHLALMEIALEIDKIAEGLDRVRRGNN